MAIYIDVVYRECRHNQKTYSQLDAEFAAFIEDAMEGDGDPGPEKIIERYLELFPPEDAPSEHLLVTARRRIGKYINSRGVSTDEFARIAAQPHILFGGTWDDAAVSARRFQVARLLGEIGAHGEAFSLFERVAASEEKRCGRSSGFILAKAFQALMRQNQGLFPEAKKLLDEVEKAVGPIDGKVSTGWVEAYPSHVFLKHAGTLKRRNILQSSSRPDGARLDRTVLKDAFDLLERANAVCETHFVQYSIGYLYYLAGEPDEAVRRYTRSLELLGATHSVEYYLVFIKMVLAMMSAGKAPPQFEDYLATYEKSLDLFPNYKSRLNKYPLNLIKYARRGDTLPPASFSGLVRSLEEFFCIRQDVMTILTFNFGENRIDEEFIRSVRAEFLDIEKKFDHLNSILAVNSVIAEPSPAIGVCFDIRKFTSQTRSDDAIAIEKLLDLRDQIRPVLLGDFDAANYAGDGYLFVKSVGNLKGKALISTFEDLVAKCASVLAGMSGTAIGIGISFGTVTLIRNQKKTEQRYFIGGAANDAARMCDMAKPSGMVINANGLTTNIGELETLDLPLSFRKISWKDKNGDPYEAYASAETGASALLARSSKSFEKRFFVNAGKACRRGCVYCINRTFHSGPGIGDPPREDIASRFAREFEAETAGVEVDDYLFSLGHLNEPLDDDNFQSTAGIVAYLLGRTRSSLQIATKQDYPAISRFLRELEARCPLDAGAKERLHFFYSLSTIAHAESLEGGRTSVRADLESLSSLAADEGYKIIPYIKPFLPGITDEDEGLVEALDGFEIVAVGYPYLSRLLLDEMAEYCLRSSLTDAAGTYYRSAGAAGTPIRHPSYINEFDLPEAYISALTAFVERLGDKRIFISSPCASAYIAGRSSFTQVGSRRFFPEGHSILCRGQAGERPCVNLACLYNRRFSGA
jgi:tetratricopeptide (TPR) repeat protein